ncbi:MAG: IgGFc-binding protein, partial [Caldilineaceae bacterium]|nr:IgGFc-binding protein [Caldilineaceae bacterium]
MVKRITQRWHRPSTRQSTELLVALWFALLGTLWIAQPANAAPPPPVQHFYVPLPEDQIFHALQKIYPGNTICPAFGENPVNPINTYISISALSDNTIIYYDHWEDGFEIDVTRPQQATTQIWGDGNPANGTPPGIPSDIIMADTVIVLENPVNTNTLATVIDFDGGDRVSASNMIAMTRAAWATGSSTLLAGAIEVYDTNSWGTTYEAPVGQNVDYNQLFEYSSISVMAAQDDTTLFVDFDGDGTEDGFTVIDQGRAYHVDGGINAGSRIRATGPVQVSLVTGDVCSNYESRWFALFPTERWSNSYYNPVSSPAGDGTTVFLYNATSNPITVQWATTAGAQTPLSVGARGVSSVVVPNGTGSHFFTADGTNFMAVAAIDSDGPENTNAKADWGFTLVPERMLTQQIMVGWGPGRDPLSSVRPSENGSPVWVMPIINNGAGGPVNICVDY